MNKEIINQPRAIKHSLLFGLSGTSLSIGALLFIGIMKNIDQSLLLKQGVYKITNIKRNRIYIGSTARSFKSRFNNHLKDLRKLTHHSYKLQQDFLIDGIDNFVFDIIVITEPDNAVKEEQHYLDFINPYYNILKRADSNFGHKMTAEQCNRMSLAKSKKINEQEVIIHYLKYGMTKTAHNFHIGPKRLKRILIERNIHIYTFHETTKILKNLPKYDEQKIIKMYSEGISIREIRRKEHTTQKRIKQTLKDNGIEIIRHPPLNAEQLKSLSESLTGRVLDDQWRENIAKAKVGKKIGGDNGNARKVINIDTNVIYGSIQEVSELYGMPCCLLSDRLHGRTKNDTPFVLLKKNKIALDIKPYVLNIEKKFKRAFKRENLLA